MKVNISVVGRFHIFDLARELNKSNILNRLITTYPKFKVKEWDIPTHKVISEVPLEILNRYRSKVPFFSDNNVNFFIKKLHDKDVLKHVHECDIFIGWSGSSLDSLIESKKRKKISILERGSSHFSYAVNILTEEYKDNNISYTPNYKQWQQELLEYELVDYISIPSSFVKRSFIEYGVPEEKLLVNPYGVDLSSFKQIKKEDNTFRVIFCGTLSLQKGSHYLLEAFFNLNLQNAELWHIGNILDEMDPFIDRYKSDKIIYKGSYPQNELYKLYSQGSVFIIPSIQEGMAMVQLQAMACGLPLICTTNTGGDDLITKNGEEGFVIPIRSVESIKEKIKYLFENQDICRNMGQKAKKRVSSGFTWDDYGKRYIENLKRIVGE